MTYSAVSDMLLGDLQLSSRIDLDRAVENAGDEIDSRIGFRYELPLPFEDMPEHARLLLKRISNNLATGRVLHVVSQFSEDDDDAMKRYGSSLVREALADLALITNGTIDLPGAIPLADSTVVAPRGPSIVNTDAYSAVDAFAGFAMQGVTTDWRPGA